MAPTARAHAPKCKSAATWLCCQNRLRRVTTRRHGPAHSFMLQRLPHPVHLAAEALQPHTRKPSRQCRRALKTRLTFGSTPMAPRKRVPSQACQRMRQKTATLGPTPTSLVAPRKRGPSRLCQRVRKDRQHSTPPQPTQLLLVALPRLESGLRVWMFWFDEEGPVLSPNSIHKDARHPPATQFRAAYRASCFGW